MIFLDQSEIEALTGKVRRPAQEKALNSMGIEHKIRPDGKIVVLRSHIETTLGGPKSERTQAAREPNWEYLHA
jgi:hypothetical protein